jgi:hypothetical protein
MKLLCVRITDSATTNGGALALEVVGTTVELDRRLEATLMKRVCR